MGPGRQTVRQKRDEKKKKGKSNQKNGRRQPHLHTYFSFSLAAQPAPPGAAFVTKVLQVSAVYDELYLKKNHVELCKGSSTNGISK